MRTRTFCMQFIRGCDQGKLVHICRVRVTWIRLYHPIFPFGEILISFPYIPASFLR